MAKMQTPWGMADSVDQIGEGIVFVSTPSHGGYFVPPALNATIPATVKALTFNRLGESGWYEEDCDAALVPVYFPNWFGKSARERAQDFLRSYRKFEAAGLKIA